MVYITLFQALLLLLNKYKNIPNAGEQLRQILLSGPQTATDYDFLNQIIQKEISGVLATYKIRNVAQDVENDASRRFFETHLAYETLLSTLPQLPQVELQDYYTSLYSLMRRQIGGDLILHREMMNILNGNNPSNVYSESIKKLDESPFHSLSDNNKNKLSLLIKTIYLSNEIQKKMHYRDANQNVFRQELCLQKQNNVDVQSNHVGTMKSNMALPKDSVAISPSSSHRRIDSDDRDFLVAFQDTEYSVHQYIQNDSNVMLTQLEIIAYLLRKKDLDFSSSELLIFLKCLVAYDVYQYGTNHLAEMLAPFKNEDIQQCFKCISGFSSCDMQALFLKNNEAAFEKALHETIKYNIRAIHLKEVHLSLHDYFKNKMGYVETDSHNENSDNMEIYKKILSYRSRSRSVGSRSSTPSPSRELPARRGSDDTIMRKLSFGSYETPERLPHIALPPLPKGPLSPPNQKRENKSLLIAERLRVANASVKLFFKKNGVTFDEERQGKLGMNPLP